MREAAVDGRWQAYAMINNWLLYLQHFGQHTNTARKQPCILPAIQCIRYAHS